MIDFKQSRTELLLLSDDYPPNGTDSSLKNITGTWQLTATVHTYENFLNGSVGFEIWDANFAGF